CLGLLLAPVFLGGFTEAILPGGPGNAFVLAPTAPFWVVLLGRVFFGERPPLQSVVGLLLGFVGVVLIVWSQLGGEAGGAELAAGMVLALAAALGWAAGTMLVKELLQRRPDIDSVGLTTGQFLVGGAALLIASFGGEGSDGAEWSSGKLWLAVTFLSIVGSAAATIAYFGALRRLGATRVTAWGFISPVVAVLLEVVLGHSPRPVVLVGMAVPIAGGGLVTTVRADARPAPTQLPTGWGREPASPGRRRSR